MVQTDAGFRGNPLDVAFNVFSEQEELNFQDDEEDDADVVVMYDILPDGRVVPYVPEYNPGLYAWQGSNHECLLTASSAGNDGDQHYVSDSSASTDDADEAASNTDEYLTDSDKSSNYESCDNESSNYASCDYDSYDSDCGDFEFSDRESYDSDEYPDSLG